MSEDYILYDDEWIASEEYSSDDLMAGEAIHVGTMTHSGVLRRCSKCGVWVDVGNDLKPQTICPACMRKLEGGG